MHIKDTKATTHHFAHLASSRQESQKNVRANRTSRRVVNRIENSIPISDRQKTNFTFYCRWLSAVKYTDTMYLFKVTNYCPNVLNINRTRSWNCLDQMGVFYSLMTVAKDINNWLGFPCVRLVTDVGHHKYLIVKR